MSGTDSFLSTLGNYLLLEQLGQGGMGTVHKARHTQTGQLVAIKIMSPQVARNPVLLKRFEQEFRIASRLDHPNIVRVLEYSGSAPSPYLVMELIEGESVGDKLDREGRMAEDHAIYIIVQMAHGLHRAHRQGLIHRDVKPDNILLTREGQAKLTDLGLAKDSDATENLTRTGAGMGTPDYMAPEQFRNAKNAGIPCDIYSLAATLYHMVTGQPPFDGPDAVSVMKAKLNSELVPPRKRVAELSERTERAICQAMSLEPEKRPASCRAFVEELTGQSTRSTQKVHTRESAGHWYVVYQDKEGKNCTTKAPTETLREALRAGHMGDIDKVRCSRSAEGPFLPATQQPVLMQHAAAAVFSANDTIKVKLPEENGSPVASLLPPSVEAPHTVNTEEKKAISTTEVPKRTGWLNTALLSLIAILLAVAIGSLLFRQK